MFRASFIRKHGIRYDESAMAEDYELWSRCIPIAKICEYPHVLLNYRVHAAQISTAHSSDGKRNRVRERMLSWLGIAPSQREVLVHYHFCTDSPSPDVSLREQRMRACFMPTTNITFSSPACHPRSHPALFAAVKQLLQKRIPLNEVLGMELMRKALALVQRLYAALPFSRRLNGLSNYL